MTVVSRADAQIDRLEMVRRGASSGVADVVIFVSSDAHGDQVLAAARACTDIEVLDVVDPTFAMHAGGKIGIALRAPLNSLDDLSMAYTPGVARVCQAIHREPEHVFELTMKQNTVAIVTDGTAVLGLGDIGPRAAMPVMEGKAMLFKELADVDAVPICLGTTDVDEIVHTVSLIATPFGGVNLEDISSPRCFDVEKRLQAELDIPVFHDDQHGTAVVVLAALINSLRLVRKELRDVKVVVSGVGAAGIACSRMLVAAGVRNVIGCDQTGALYRGRTARMNEPKRSYCTYTNPDNEHGTIHDAMRRADVFVGVSGPSIIGADDVKAMARDPIVFALANPVPEVTPEVAGPLAAIVATGRSDYPNQINNALCFPGIFKGALACRASVINEEMKLAAARAIADIVPDSELRRDCIVPGVLDKRVVAAVARAVEQAAWATGVARHLRTTAPLRAPFVTKPCSHSGEQP